MALIDSKLEINLICPVLGPQVILCLKKSCFNSIFLPLIQLYFDWVPFLNRRFEQQVRVLDYVHVLSIIE